MYLVDSPNHTQSKPKLIHNNLACLYPTLNGEKTQIPPPFPVLVRVPHQSKPSRTLPCLLLCNLFTFSWLYCVLGGSLHSVLFPNIQVESCPLVWICNIHMKSKQSGPGAGLAVCRSPYSNSSFISADSERSFFPRCPLFPITSIDDWQA